MHAYINESMAELRARLRDIGMLPIRLIKVGYDTRRVNRKGSKELLPRQYPKPAADAPYHTGCIRGWGEMGR